MKDPFRIDSSKILYHRDWVERWRNARESWEQARELEPIYLEISPVGYCNHSCTFCGVDYMLDRPEKPMIVADVLRRTLTDMAQHGVKSVMLAGAGEPLLYKPLADIIRHADAVGIDTSITTNAVLLTEAFCRTAFQAKRLSWIKASINGGDAATYARIHQTKEQDLETVLANIARAVRLREEMGSPVTIGAQLVALPEITRGDPKTLKQERIPSNIHTVIPLAMRLREIGADYLVVKPYSQHLMSTDSRVYQDVRYQEAYAWAHEAEDVANDRFKVIVRWKTMQSWDREDRGYSICHATPYAWGYIEADGNVWSCSTYLGREGTDGSFGDDRFRLGNVNEQGFWDIWTGERRRANWEYTGKALQDGGLDISECRKNCRMNQVNLDLEGLLKGKVDLRDVADDMRLRVPHVNFI